MSGGSARESATIPGLRRYLEQRGRFWEIDYTTDTVRIRWGGAGTPVQRFDRDFPDRAAAVAYADKVIAAQLAQGFVEASPPAAVAPPVPSSRHARFEWSTSEGTAFREVVQIDSTFHWRIGVIVDGVDRVRGQETERGVDAAARFDQQCAEARYNGAEEIDIAARKSEALRVARANARRARGEQLTGELDSTGSARHPELERQCLESPESPEPWLVYADWLEAQGDPRAKLAMLDRAGQHDRIPGAIREQLHGIADEDEVEEESIGAADHEVKFHCELRFGFVRHATIQLAGINTAIELEAVTRRFLASSLATFVDSLRFGLSSFEGNNDWEPTLRAVVESALASRLRALAFDAFDCEDQEWSWVEFGNFTGLLARLPALEELRIRSGGGGVLGTLELPNLRTFVRESGGLRRDELDAIARASWPALRHLEIWTGSSDYGAVATTTDLNSILDADGLPALRHLGIVNSELVGELIPALANSAVLPQLESLDLSRGTLASSTSFIKHAAAFRHLASIDLDSNTLPRDEAAAIRAVLDNVIIGSQREDSRYVEVGE